MEFKNMGPKRDVLAEWEKAARKHELPFGISFHADHAWTWYEPSQRYDRNGPKAGIPYDGTLTKANGKGNGGKDTTLRTFMRKTIR